jgi:hypothetical protein
MGHKGPQGTVTFPAVNQAGQCFENPSTWPPEWPLPIVDSCTFFFVIEEESGFIYQHAFLWPCPLAHKQTGQLPRTFQGWHGTGREGHLPRPALPLTCWATPATMPVLSGQ